MSSSPLLRERRIRAERRRRHARLLACVGLGAVLTLGCAGGLFGSAGGDAEASRGLARIAKTRVIRVGMSGEQPPLNMTTRDGDLIGLEVALMNVLAKVLEARAEFVQRPFGELLDALEAGEVDMVMSGMAITPERNMRALFVGPYYVSGKALLTRSAELAAVVEARELNQASLRFAALAGSTSERFVKRVLPAAGLVTVPRIEGAIDLVLTEQVDALVADIETCHFARLRHPDAGLRTSRKSFTVEPMGIAVPSDDPPLANLMENYLKAIEAGGTMERVRRYWFENDEWVGALR